MSGQFGCIKNMGLRKLVSSRDFFKINEEYVDFDLMNLHLYE